MLPTYYTAERVAGRKATGIHTKQTLWTGFSFGPWGQKRNKAS